MEFTGLCIFGTEGIELIYLCNKKRINKLYIVNSTFFVNFSIIIIFNVLTFTNDKINLIYSQHL